MDRIKSEFQQITSAIRILEMIRDAVFGLAVVGIVAFMVGAAVVGLVVLALAAGLTIGAVGVTQAHGKK